MTEETPEVRVRVRRPWTKALQGETELTAKTEGSQVRGPSVPGVRALLGPFS